VRREIRGLTAAAAAACAVLAACSSSPGAGQAHPQAQKTIGIVRFATPPAGRGCAGAKPAPGGATTIPVTVSTRQTQVAAMANVCIGGRGPFPFLIDTGAAGSVVTASLAKAAGLPAIGQPILIGGADCTAQARNSRITSWNVAGLVLQPQNVIYLAVPGFGGKGEPDGVLGSDVWSRFGAMRLDFRHELITVPGPEQPVPTRDRVVSKPSASPLPASLLHGTATVTAPMMVNDGPLETVISVPVSLGSRPPAEFTPDTGASQSVVDSGVARSAGLTEVHTKVTQDTVCTVVTVPEVNSGPWSVAGHPLTPQPLGSTALEQDTGAAGLLGADQMSRFGSVVFDYAGGRLILGADS
jgi:predicted small secreted protein